MMTHNQISAAGAARERERSRKLATPQLDLILLDASGSMCTKWPATTKALDTYINDLKAAHLNTHLLIASFATEDCFQLEHDGTLASCPCFSDPLLPAHFSGTPLYDSINAAARRLRDLSPPRATILIITDGDENGSSYTSLTQARGFLDWMRYQGYQVIFMGCDFNNSLQARELGANADTSIGVSKALLTDAAHLLARKRTNYGLHGSEIHFSESEQTQFGGLLPHHT